MSGRKILDPTMYSSTNVRNPSTRQHSSRTHGVMYPVYKLYNPINKTPNKARKARIFSTPSFNNLYKMYHSINRGKMISCQLDTTYILFRARGYIFLID